MTKYVFLSAEHPIFSTLKVGDVGFVIAKGNPYSIQFFREGVTVEISHEYITDFDIESTGDEFENKVCDRCFKLLKTADNFSKNRHKKGDKITNRPSCKSCRKEKDGKRISSAERQYWEARKPPDYTPFTCPICSKTTITGVTKIVLDHCHRTGRVRGYLCESCNTGIGRFDDQIELALRAVDWLNGKQME